MFYWYGNNKISCGNITTHPLYIYIYIWFTVYDFFFSIPSNFCVQGLLNRYQDPYRLATNIVWYGTIPYCIDTCTRLDKSEKKSPSLPWLYYPIRTRLELGQTEPNWTISICTRLYHIEPDRTVPVQFECFWMVRNPGLFF